MMNSKKSFLNKYVHMFYNVKTAIFYLVKVLLEQKLYKEAYDIIDKYILNYPTNFEA